MKILLLTQYYVPEVGAAQARLEALSQELLRLGHEVEVITAMPNYPYGKVFDGYDGFSKTENQDGVLIRRFWVYASQGKGVRRLWNYFSFMLTSFFAVFQKRKPDLIFVNSGPLFLGIPGIFFSWWYSCPLVFNVSDLWPRSVEHLATSLSGKIFIRLSEHLEKWIYKKADYVNAITEGVEKILLEDKKIPRGKVLFLPNGVDFNLFVGEGLPDRAAVARESLALNDKFVLVYPGNHGFAHALEYVLTAAELLQNETISTAHFLLIGGGSEKARLQEIAAEKKLKNVTFLAPVAMNDLPPFLLMADAGIIHIKDSPLAMETRPAKMFPLMAAKLPILFCGFGEGRKLLQATQPEWILDPEKPSLIAQKIKEMMAQTSQLKFQGQKNFEYVKSEFSTSSLIQRWLHSLEGKLNR